jgi:outer membrane translocation and assembly module TamA
VNERHRWMVGTGVRWRTETGEEVLLDLRDENLLGRGFAVTLRGHYGSRSRAGRTFLSLPPLPGGRIAFEGGASIEQRELEGDVRERVSVFSLESRLYQSLETQLRAYLRREQTRREDLTPSPESPRRSLATLGTIGGQIVTERRDDPFYPTRGWYGALDLSYSPRWLDSDSQVARGLLTYGRADTMGRRWTLAQGLRVGISEAFGENLPFTDAARFFAGGENTIRGFQERSVGPFELVVDPDGATQRNYLGGGALAILNEEIRFAITQRIQIAAFADAGQVWRDWSEATWSFSVGAGVGVRILTPVGPGRLDVAWPITNRQGQSGARFYFGIGQAF